MLSGSLSLLWAIKFVFASLLRLDVTDRLEPEKREIFSSALLLPKMLAFECLNFTLGGSLIPSLVRKLSIRHPQKQCKIFTLGGSLIPSLCQTRPINSETEDFVRQAVDGLGERDSPSRLPLEPHQDLLDVIVCL